MSHSDPTGALFLGTGAGVWIFFKGFRVFREFKIVADTPRMPIRSVSMGLVQVRGTALSDKLIPSPVTCTPCCFYQVKIERYENRRTRRMEAPLHGHGRRQVLSAGQDRQSTD